VCAYHCSTSPRHNLCQRNGKINSVGYNAMAHSECVQKCVEEKLNAVAAAVAKEDIDNEAK